MEASEGVKRDGSGCARAARSRRQSSVVAAVRQTAHPRMRASACSTVDVPQLFVPVDAAPQRGRCALTRRIERRVVLRRRSARSRAGERARLASRATACRLSLRLRARPACPARSGIRARSLPLAIPRARRAVAAGPARRPPRACCAARARARRRRYHSATVPRQRRRRRTGAARCARRCSTRTGSAGALAPVEGADGARPRPSPSRSS